MGGATLSGLAGASRSSAPTTVATPFAAVPQPTQSLPADHPFSNAAQLLADVREDLASYGERFTAWQSDGHISGIGGICVTTMGGDPDPCPVYATTYATSALGESVGVVGCRSGPAVEFLYVRVPSARIAYLSDPSAPQPWTTVPLRAVPASERSAVALFLARAAHAAWSVATVPGGGIYDAATTQVGPVGIQATFDGSEASVVVAGPSTACQP